MRKSPVRRIWRHVRGPVIALLAGTLLSAKLAGCASPGYLGDRGRDFADVFTATVGFGAGAKARVGPIQAGLLYNVDTHGLRGGQFGEAAWYEVHTFETVAPYPMKLRRFDGDEDYPWEYPGYCFGRDRWQTGTSERRLAGRRGKNYEAVSPVPFISLAGQPAYYTQIEVVVALIGSLRVGFNPGELLDFVLGWTTIDLFQDDLGTEQVISRATSCAAWRRA